ncbi:DUF1214 domain-containing protein [Myxococcota bacterium]|nr:DUF1214 domain-containing protein [Myxococcota bacterium]
MSGEDPTAMLKSGAAWEDFCEELKGAGADLLRAESPDGSLDLVEGHRYLTRMLRAAFEQIVEAGDAAVPAFFESLHSTCKSGWDNPDNIHTNAYINAAYEYRVTGTRGDAHYLSFGVYGGSFGKKSGRRTVAYVAIDELDVAPDGTFELVLSAKPHEGNWIRLEPDATTLMVRQTFWDKSRERPAELSIERIDSGAPPDPLDPAFFVSALRRSLRFIRGTNAIFFPLADTWREKPNTFFRSDPERAAQTIGIPNMLYSSGWWEIEPDEAIVLDLKPPRCRYWGLVLSNYWGESLDYTTRTVHTNKERAVYASDGSARIVVAHRDPDLPQINWLDTAGHASGVWTLRWLEADDYPLPDVRVVKHADLINL